MPDLALVLFSGGLVAWATGEAGLTSTDRPAPRTLALSTGLLVLAGHVIGVVEHLGNGSSPGWAIAVGGAMFAVGIGLRLSAIATLGPAFATALESARLITSGPYRWMRHPSEAGLTAAMLGGSVLLASRLALLATVAAVPIAIVRCRREDTALADRHRVAHAEWVAAVGWFWRRRSRRVPPHAVGGVHPDRCW